MIHKHSIETYQSIMQDGSKETRKRALLEIIESSSEPMTDYEVLQSFKSGSDNMNLVRPRLTDLHNSGVLVAGPPTKNDRGYPIRTSILPLQLELF